MANVYTPIDDILAMSSAGGGFLKPVRLLQQKYPLLKAMPFVECNKTDSHEYSSDFSLPDPVYRVYNEGIEATDGRSTVDEEKTTMLSDRMAIDEDMLETNGHSMEYLEQKAYQHIEAIYQEIERAIFYNTLAANPNRFNGLAVRYGTLNSEVSKQIIDHDGAGTETGSDQTSIWLMVLDPSSIAMLYPKGTPAGLRRKELPTPTLVTDSGGSKQFRGIVVDWLWKFGLLVQDWRQAVRIANIDSADTLATDYDIVPVMTRATHRVENLKRGQAGFWLNRHTMELLDLQCQNNSKTVALEKYVEEGVLRTSLRGVPIHVTDGISITEDLVS